MILPSEQFRLSSCNGYCACEACSKKNASSEATLEFKGADGFIHIYGFDAEGNKVAGPIMFDPYKDVDRVANNFRGIAEWIERVAKLPNVVRVRVGIR